MSAVLLIPAGRSGGGALKEQIIDTEREARHPVMPFEASPDGWVRRHAIL